MTRKDFWADIPTVESLDLPEFEMSGIKELDMRGFTVLDDHLPLTDTVERRCLGCDSTFRVLLTSTRIWCSDRCGWRMRKCRQRRQ